MTVNPISPETLLHRRAEDSLATERRVYVNVGFHQGGRRFSPALRLQEFGCKIADWSLMLYRAPQGDCVEPLFIREHSVGDTSSEIDELWTRLRNRDPGPEQIYRSPAYLSFAGQGGRDVSTSLIAISNARGEIVGLAPARLGAVELAFTWGFHKLARMKLHALAILGSEPLVTDRADLAGVFRALTRWGDHDVIELEYLRQDSPLWEYIRDSEELQRSFLVHVVDDFRPCHFVKTPNTLDDYYHSLTRKRRYNFLRQERLLRAAVGGELELIRVTSSCDFPILAEAIRALSGWEEQEIARELKHLGSLCDYGLLCCYVLKAADRNIALCLGYKYLQTLHVMRFLHDEKLNASSPGTTLWQRVLRDVIEKGEQNVIYLGYGEPRYRFSGSNQICLTGRVLLFKRTPLNWARVMTHKGYGWVKQRVKFARRAA